MSEKLLVRRAAVLGAGVMGAQIAAQLTNAGVEVRMSAAGVELLAGPGFDAAKLDAL